MLADDELTDDELAAIALDADPDVEVGDDATSLVGSHRIRPVRCPPAVVHALPAGGSRSRILRPHSRWRRRVALLVISSFVIIDAYGLCATYGPLVLA